MDIFCYIYAMLERWLQWIFAALPTKETPGGVLLSIRLFLVYVYPHVLDLLLLFTAAALFLSLPAVRRALLRPSARAWLLALALFDGALLLRLFDTPHMPQVYFDEICFLDAADMMSQYSMAAISTVDVPLGQLFQPCPVGWQYLISLVYRCFGVHVGLAFTLASVLSALSVLLMFLVLFEMTGRARVGLWGALILALLPIHLRLSGSAALETPSLFFLLATLYAFHLWMAAPRWPLLLLTGACAAWFANIRMENGLVLCPALVIYAFVLCPRSHLRGRRNLLTVSACLLFAILFSMPAFLADFYGLCTHFYLFYQSAGKTESQIALNARGNLFYWFNDRIHPLSLTLLAIFGAIQTWRMRRGWVAFWLCWWIGLTVFYTLNASCDFSLQHTYDSWRTALHPAFGVILLSAVGIDALLSQIARCGARNAATVLMLGLIACLLPLFRNFVQLHHVLMLRWQTSAEMRAHLPVNAAVILNDPVNVYGASGVNLAYEIALTTGIAPQYFCLPGEMTMTGAESPPQIVQDVERWKVEKRPVFLYHLDESAPQDALEWSQISSLFRMRLIEGTSDRRHRESFSYWDIDGTVLRGPTSSKSEGPLKTLHDAPQRGTPP